MNELSSRSLSKMRIEPSEKEARKREGELGTQWTAVQGEEEIEPCIRLVMGRGEEA